jgi:hypothetical protein
METLNSTKYGLITRAVNASVDVLPNDTALVCDISDGSIAVNLCRIPDNSWQTSYKLYVSISATKTGNAVRIQAGDGQKINGQSYLDLTSIDYVAIIRVTTNNTYIAQLNYSQATEISVLDEGNELTSSVSSINFTGSGVTATASGNDVKVDIPDINGGLVSVVSLTSKTLPIAAAGTRRVSDGTIFNATNSLSYDTVLEYGSFTTASSGLLVIGVSYTISNYVAGDDFTNVGGTNVTGNTFVASGTTPASWNNSSTLTFSTFSASTGVWTCPATGYYDITCFLALIANASPNENAISPNFWQGNGTGSANIEAIAATPHNIDFDEYIGSFGVCAEAAGTIYCQQHVPVYFNNSCINISGTYTSRYITQGTQISCKFLNKTQLIGGGVAGSSFHFTVKRVY